MDINWGKLSVEYLNFIIIKPYYSTGITGWFLFLSLSILIVIVNLRGKNGR